MRHALVASVCNELGRIPGTHWQIQAVALFLELLSKFLGNPLVQEVSAMLFGLSLLMIYCRYLA